MSDLAPNNAKSPKALSKCQACPRETSGSAPLRPEIKAQEILAEFPHSWIAKDPEAGLAEALDGRWTTFAFVAHLLFEPLAVRVHKGAAA
jgi:hypothetical protein